MICRRPPIDERGAILLIALFIAVFAVAILYSVVSTAETLLFREHLQDAADSAALSAAVMHARSMNFIVLINIVMAALLAILVTIKLVEGLCILGMVLAAAAAWFTAGASLAAIPPLKSVHSTMEEAYANVKPPVFTALEVLHDAADTVRDIAPVAASTLATSEVQQFSGSVVNKGIAAGSRLSLPVEDDSFDSLCGKGGQYATGLALLPFSPILDKLHLGDIKGELKDAVGDMTEAMSGWFCSDSSDGPPSFKRTEERSYPRVMLRGGLGREVYADEACKDDPDVQGKGKDATSTLCEKIQHDEEDGQPDKDTGECQAGHDCSLGGPYDARVTVAREQCDPEKAPAPFRYWAEIRRGTVRYIWNGKLWQRQEPRFEAPVNRRFDGPPCGAAHRSPQIAVGYNTTVHPGTDVSQVLPVCSTEERPDMPIPAPARGETRTVAFTEVENILGCKRKEEVPIPISDGASAGSSDDGNSKSPKRIEPDVTLGDEAFQIRALMQGDLGRMNATRLVRLSLWHAPDPSNPLASLTELGGLSMAQAEYFYDSAEGRDAWMWNMNWRARLVRFRLPGRNSDAWKAVQTACRTGLGSACGSVLAAVSQYGALIAH